MLILVHHVSERKLHFDTIFEHEEMVLLTSNALQLAGTGEHLMPHAF